MTELEKFLAECETEVKYRDTFAKERILRLVTLVRKQDEVLELYGSVVFDDHGNRANSCRAECDEIVRGGK